MDLITTNVYSKNLTDKVIIYGACLEDEWPDIVNEVAKGKTRLSVCPECIHISTIVEKVASMLAKSDVRELTVLTKDGSPHCIGLHYAVEWARTMSRSNVKLIYYVIEHGKLFHVPEERIKEKRHLSR
jgi:hypothetical protein